MSPLPGKERGEAYYPTSVQQPAGSRWRQQSAASLPLKQQWLQPAVQRASSAVCCKSAIEAAVAPTGSPESDKRSNHGMDEAVSVPNVLYFEDLKYYDSFPAVTNF